MTPIADQAESRAVTRAPWSFLRLAEWPALDAFGNFAHQGVEMIRIEEFLEREELVIRAELPGIDPDKDVEVSIWRGALHIDVTHEEKSGRKERSGFRTEFRYGAFSRSIPLPAGTYETEVKATYADGVLEVRLPIAKAAKRKVDVSRP